MIDQQYKICSRCVMDTSDPFIRFDSLGICNHCTDYFNKSDIYTYQGQKTDLALSSLMKQIRKKGKNKMYDCVVGISGGVDSSYVAYMAKKMGLRILAVHFDNGWNSELAVKNIENIVTTLDLDYQTYVVDYEEFKDLQKSFLKASVHNAETPSDHAFLGALYKIAARYNIKYILSGSNFATEGILPKSWGYNAKDITHLKAIQKKFGSKKLKTFPFLGLYKELYYTYMRGIKMIRLLNYVPYVKKDAMKVLEQELNWQYYGGKHYESRFTKFFQSYILPLKFGIDKRKAHLSTLICAGEITRDEALVVLGQPTYDHNIVNEDLEFICKKLDISSEEFESIMNDNPKSYKDYPNGEKMLNFIYKVYNILKRSGKR